MLRLGIAVAGLLLFAGAEYAVYQSGYSRAAGHCAEAQAKMDRKAYAEVIDKIKSDNVNVDDPAAVDCLLRELAGEPAGPECSGL